MTTEKMVEIEFFLLDEDETWDTEIGRAHV